MVNEKLPEVPSPRNTVDPPGASIWIVTETPVGVLQLPEIVTPVGNDWLWLPAYSISSELSVIMNEKLW